MATHSSILGWRIPQIEEPRGLQSTGSQSQTRMKQLACIQARLIKKKKEKTQINKIRNEKGEVIRDNTEIQRLTGDYHEELEPIKWNLE